MNDSTTPGLLLAPVRAALANNDIYIFKTVMYTTSFPQVKAALKFITCNCNHDNGQFSQPL
jgi:hypothetical protein